MRRTITVMTRNLYLGANLDPIVSAMSAGKSLDAVAAGWTQVQANDFPTRARAIAAEVASVEPDFVGLQELALFRTQAPVDAVQTPATTAALDYELELQQAFAERDLRYRFVVSKASTDVELSIGEPPTMHVRMTLRNALLVRNGISVGDVRCGNYLTVMRMDGGPFLARRGWVSADATIAGTTFRVIATHLESYDRATQEAQSEEILSGPARTELPVVLLGDLNSLPDGSTTATYANLVAGGFDDAWTRAYPDAPGLTCCHGEDLRLVGGAFTERIDYVLMRGGFEAVRGAVTGEAESTRLDGLWPSDHGGVWLTLRLPAR